MGAPGEAFLCQRGHLYHWIEDDLYWGSGEEDGLWGESRKARVEGCPCGEKRVLVLNHYGGDVNDCLCSACEVDQKGVKQIGTETLLLIEGQHRKPFKVVVPIPDGDKRFSDVSWSPGEIEIFPEETAGALRLIAHINVGRAGFAGSAIGSELDEIIKRIRLVRFPLYDVSNVLHQFQRHLK